MSFLWALGIYVLFLAAYWFFVLTILWHVREYILPKGYPKWVVRMFLAVIILLNIMSLVLFFNLPLA